MSCLYLNISEKCVVSFSRTDSGLCIYHLFVWWNFNYLHNSKRVTFPTQSCLVLYSFSSNLLLLLIIWLIVSSLSLHNLYLLFCCVLSIFTLTLFVLMALFCAAVRRDSVFLERFLFLSHVQIFSCEIPFVAWNIHTVVFLPIFIT